MVRNATFDFKSAGAKPVQGPFLILVSVQLSQTLFHHFRTQCIIFIVKEVLETTMGIVICTQRRIHTGIHDGT